MVNRIARDGSIKAALALALALALASGSAAALGLGQLELKSKLGEPLLAEIAIVSSDPSELEQLRAGLASPETFTRVGLQPPEGIVAQLRFDPALNDAGEAVIRVTSSQPIDQAVLTFLIEVDWGQGRLVREYSTLLDAPRTVSAPMQPPIDAPVLAPDNTIVRAPEIAPLPEQELGPADAMPVDPDAIAASPTPVPPTPASRAAAPAPPAPAPGADRYGAVQQGETLSQIASSLGLGIGLDQAMVALLRANPEAFINGNINLLKQGAVLRVPERDQLQRIGRAEASALVRSQVQQWRQVRAAAVQPVAVDGASAVAASTDDAAGQAAGGARLEIVPPGASRAARAGTQSGISAGGEGEMLRQELQQTRETLAAREAELAEMQSRVAELEKLQSDQRQLISMKDSELAAAQQRLATAQPATPPPAEAARGNSLPWILGGVGLLLVLLMGWAWRRYSAATMPVFRAPNPSRPSLADAFAPATPASAVASTDDSGDTAGGATADFAGTLPLWEQSQPAPGSAASGSPPAWHDAGATPSAGRAAAGATSTVDVPGRERLQLARAYLDLGDHANARGLLTEIVAAGDPDHSHQAAQMLHELE